MQISISARHGHLSDATRAKIAAKVEKLARLFERLQSIEVTIDLEHEETPTVDILVSATRKHDFVATESGGSLMGALDGTIHKLENQLRKYKEKAQDHHRAPSREVPAQNAEGEEEDRRAFSLASRFEVGCLRVAARRRLLGRSSPWQSRRAARRPAMPPRDSAVGVRVAGRKELFSYEVFRLCECRSHPREFKRG